MSFEHRHDLFEEARKARLDSIKRDLIRDNLMPAGGIPNVPYYRTIDEQNHFLQSISNTEFGRQLQNWQVRYNAQGVPLILPKFHDVENISLNEQLFLAMQSIGLEKYQDGTYRVDGGKKQSILFKQLALTKGKIGSFFQFVEPSKYYISIGAVPEHLLEKKYGTGFQRGQAYQAPIRDEPIVITGVKPFEKSEITRFQPKKTLSPKIKKIIDDWSVKKIIVPAWFANNNMNWVLEGRITEQEFLDAYTNLVNTGAITFTTPEVTIAPIPEITIPSIPEVSAEMELITTNFQVKLDNKIQFSSSLSNADYKRLQDEMSLEPKITLVFLNQTDFNPLSNFSKILRQIQNLLRDQIVETITISPTGEVITAPEPTVTGKPGLMGAGVLGVIGILMLGGFIADHVRKRK